MDPNNPHYSNISPHLSDLPDDFVNNPQRTRTTSGPSTSGTVNSNEPFEYSVGRPPNIDFDTYVDRRITLRDRETHLSLKHDMVEHIWQNYGPNNSE